MTSPDTDALTVPEIVGEACDPTVVVVGSVQPCASVRVQVYVPGQRLFEVVATGWPFFDQE